MKLLIVPKAKLTIGLRTLWNTGKILWFEGDLGLLKNGSSTALLIERENEMFYILITEKVFFHGNCYHWGRSLPLLPLASLLALNIEGDLSPYSL